MEPPTVVLQSAGAHGQLPAGLQEQLEWTNELLPTPVFGNPAAAFAIVRRTLRAARLTHPSNQRWACGRGGGPAAFQPPAPQVRSDVGEPLDVGARKTVEGI